ncbi:uncharacterized protein LOC141856501 [Brevipalpus obovatus]|uniref:uncharacterized protein LOC141856501 n=1 Tax=Brevipalpus obovatus TaxID=246614 RepID=UPI003D9E2E1A
MSFGVKFIVSVVILTLEISWVRSSIRFHLLPSIWTSINTEFPRIFSRSAEEFEEEFSPNSLELNDGTEYSHSTPSSSAKNPVEERYLQFISRLPSVRRHPFFDSSVNDDFSGSFPSGQSDWRPSESSPWSKLSLPLDISDSFKSETKPNSHRRRHNSVVKTKHHHESPFDILTKGAFFKTPESPKWSKWKSSWLSDDLYSQPIYYTTPKVTRPTRPRTTTTKQAPLFSLFNQPNADEFDIGPLQPKNIDPALAKILPDENGCKTVLKEIHELPGIKPKQIVRLIRNRRGLIGGGFPAFPEDLSLAESRRSVTLLMVKHCVEPNDTSTSGRNELKSFKIRPLLDKTDTGSAGSQIADQLKKLVSPLTKAAAMTWDDVNNDDFLNGDKGNDRTSLLANVYDEKGGDDEWIDRGLNKNRQTFDEPSSNGYLNDMDDEQSNHKRPSQFNVHEIGGSRGRDSDSWVPNFPYMPSNQNPGNKYSGRRITSGFRKSHSGPKKIDSSISYYQKRRPQINRPNTDHYTVNFGNENYQSYHEDYDSDRDGLTTSSPK